MAVPQTTSEWEAKQAREQQIEMFSTICSEVSDGLFVGSAKVASNRQILAQHGITHIVNCAAQHHANAFADEIEYLTLYLHDGQTELLAAVFYDVLGMY